jgi:hypothetical protein
MMAVEAKTLDEFLSWVLIFGCLAMSVWLATSEWRSRRSARQHSLKNDRA